MSPEQFRISGKRSIGYIPIGLLDEFEVDDVTRGIIPLRVKIEIMERAPEGATHYDLESHGPPQCRQFAVIGGRRPFVYVVYAGLEQQAA